MTQPICCRVVDDDRDIASNMSDILSDLGFRTDVANCGAAALDRIASRPYDLVLLDFKMPDMDGATLFERITEVQPRIAAIMVTAYAGSDGADRAKKAGLRHVLRKPVDFDVLMELIGRVVDKNNPDAA